MCCSSRFYISPFIILTFFNDLPLVLKNSANVDLYADDTTIYDVQCNIDELESNEQFSLNALHVWCRQNGIVLNTKKTNVMLITSRQRRSNLRNTNLSLRYNETDIKMTTISKILRVQVDETLLWNNQLLHVSKKVSSYLCLLSKIRQYLSKEHRLLFYNAYIKPHLGYCSTVWSNTSNSNASKINTLQRRACKLILSQTYNCLHEAPQRLDILSFDQSVFPNKAKIMYKIYNNLALVYLQELFQMRDVNLDNTASKEVY